MLDSIHTPALRHVGVYERNFLRRPLGQIPLTPPFQKGETDMSPPLCKEPVLSLSKEETEGILDECSSEFLRRKILKDPCSESRPVSFEDRIETWFREPRVEVGRS